MAVSLARKLKLKVPREKVSQTNKAEHVRGAYLKPISGLFICTDMYQCAHVHTTMHTYTHVHIHINNNKYLNKL